MDQTSSNDAADISVGVIVSIIFPIICVCCIIVLIIICVRRRRARRMYTTTIVTNSTQPRSNTPSVGRVSVEMVPSYNITTNPNSVPHSPQPYPTPYNQPVNPYPPQPVPYHNPYPPNPYSQSQPMYAPPPFNPNLPPTAPLSEQPQHNVVNEKGSTSPVPSKKLNNITVEFRLGGGNFGEVFRGTWHGTTTVALKKVKGAQQTEIDQEASVLAKLHHPNIVQYLGSYESEDGSNYLVTEYLSGGGLNEFIHKKKDHINQSDLLSMAKNAAAGMSYLEQEHIIHRDLALRNLLVTSGPTEIEKYTVKIADFGLSRVVEKEEYSSTDTARPIKWTSPEALEYGTFSTKSDVWSFGVVLWELFSFGKVPYPGLNNKDTFQEIKKGYRMSPPENCPPDVYQLMTDCWKEKPEERPNFRQIYERLHALWRATVTTPEESHRVPDNTQLGEPYQDNYNSNNYSVNYN